MIRTMHNGWAEFGVGANSSYFYHAASGQAAPMTPAEAAGELPELMPFEEFKYIFSKVYSTPEEESNRRRIFAETLKFIEKHNHEADAGVHTFRTGVNALSDLTPQEYKQQYLSSGYTSQPPTNVRKLDESAVPSSVDWRNEGAVTPVKNQGSCGSCWSCFCRLASALFLTLGLLLECFVLLTLMQV